MHRRRRSCHQLSVLPDYLKTNLQVVICGTAAARASAATGHYYSGPGNEFWELLYRSGMVPVALDPAQDSHVTEFGIGLTDLAKDIASSTDRGIAAGYDVPGLVAKVETFKPAWLAFHGKESAKAVSRFLGAGSKVRLGPQDWSVADSSVFVLPSASGANRGTGRLEGKASRLEWFSDLAIRVPVKGRSATAGSRRKRSINASG